jgi:hypothetical protein
MCHVISKFQVRLKMNIQCFTKLNNLETSYIKWSGNVLVLIDKQLTRSSGRKKAEALEDLLPAFRATALPWQSTTGEPLEPPLVPDAA